MMKVPVVAGVKDLIVCMKETGMQRRLTFPSTIFMQKTNDIGNILFQRSSGSTSISGLALSTWIATYAPIEEHMKWTQDTVRGNLKSSFCKEKKSFFCYQGRRFSPAFAPTRKHTKKQLNADQQRVSVRANNKEHYYVTNLMHTITRRRGLSSLFVQV